MSDSAVEFREAIEKSPWLMTLMDVGKRFLQARNVNTVTWHSILAKEEWIRKDVVLAEYDKAEKIQKAIWKGNLRNKIQGTIPITVELGISYVKVLTVEKILELIE